MESDGLSILCIITSANAWMMDVEEEVGYRLILIHNKTRTVCHNLKSKRLRFQALTVGLK